MAGVAEVDKHSCFVAVDLIDSAEGEIVTVEL